jgi:AhpD family alkylhydroperoxidase
MKARIDNPVLTIPGALQAMQAFNGSAEGQGVPQETIALVQLRTSQINGCHVCVGLHCGILRKVGVTDQHLDAVANWRESREFSPAERAALALTEEVTRLADRPDAVPDEVWDEAARHYDERALSALLIGIAATTVFNLLNVAVRQPAVSENQIAELAAHGVRGLPQ